MNIGGIQKTSLLDYPDKISTIVFTKGCNFNCDYCHNPELFSTTESQTFKESDFLEFLKTRIGKLDAVVITGGEPTLQPDLLEFIKKIKSFNFLIKLDTNGSNPKMLKKCLPYVDYVAIDIKAPLEKYQQITNSKINTKNILKSIELIIQSSVDYEFRTTVVKSQLTQEDLLKIGELIKGAKKYYLQKFIPSKTLNPKFINESTYTNNEFQVILQSLKPLVHEIKLR